MTILNRCPDCGSHEVFQHASKKLTDKYIIKCCSCALESDYFDSPEEAIAVWNALPPASGNPIIFECAGYAAHRDPADLYPSVRDSLIDLILFRIVAAPGSEYVSQGAGRVYSVSIIQ